MKRRDAGIRRRCSGQTLIEFMAIAVMMLGVICVMFSFLAVFTEYGWRVLNLIGLEYP